MEWVMGDGWILHRLLRLLEHLTVNMRERKDDILGFALVGKHKYESTRCSDRFSLSRLLSPVPYGRSELGVVPGHSDG